MIEVRVGDCREHIAGLEDCSIDAVVCDPPYELGFMGKAWDSTGVAYDRELWREVLRVLKPGGHLAAFGGTRTYHRLAVAIEDAGFEIRDQLAWVYGSGFPKSLDVSKAIDKAAGAEREVLSEGKAVKRMIPGADQNKVGWIKDNGREFIPTETAPATPEAAQWQGWGTALKPAWEPICLARKPLIGTVAANVLQHGTGALNIDACRVGVDAKDDIHAKNPHAVNRGSNQVYGAFREGGSAAYDSSKGRFPANLCHDGSDEVIAGFPETHAPGSNGRGKGVGIFGLGAMPQGASYSDPGSAARFFYCAKVSRAEREGSDHPTMKPVALMRWLCRLVTPPAGLILDPFAGSGSTLLAAEAERFRAIGFELSPDYAAIIESRLELARMSPGERKAKRAKAAPETRSTLL